MQMVHSKVAAEAANLSHLWSPGGFGALRTHAEWACPDSGSLLDLERRELLNAVIQRMEEAGVDGLASGETEVPDVRMETCLNLLRHLGDLSER